MSAERTDKERLEDVLTPTNGHYAAGAHDVAALRGSNGMNPESYRFVEVGHTTLDKETGQPVPAPINFHGQEGTGRGVVIDAAELDAYAAQYRHGVQRSHFQFAGSDYAELKELGAQERLSVLGDYYAVFTARSSSEIVHAINQAIDLVERLKENYNVPYEAVVVYFAGADIEVHVDYSVFGVTPGPELPQVYARMSAALVGMELGDKPPAAYSQLDFSAYRWDYLSQIQGSQVAPDKEAFKIRITYGTFKRLSYQRLNEFIQRRPDLPAREPHAELSPRARDLYLGVASALKREESGGDHDTIASIFYRIDEESGEITSAKQLAPTLLKRLFNEHRHDIHTFSPHLDRALGGGLNPGDLYVVAGFPGSGTSTFVLQMMNYIAEHQDAHCIFVSLQRGVEELFKRSLSMLAEDKLTVSEIDQKRQIPRALEEDRDFNRRLMGAYERYQTFSDRITVLEGAAASDLSRVAQFVRDRKDDLKLRGENSNVVLFVDSLQLLVAVLRAVYNREQGGDIFGDIREEDLRVLAGRLKGLARELDVTVFATMEQYECNRCTAEQCSPASLSQLFFDTQFADTVMMLSRQGPSLKALCESLKSQLQGTPLEHKVADLTKRLSEIEKTYQATEQFASLDAEFALLEILKNRSGPVDKIAYAFHKCCSQFEPVEYQ